jgi:hypothetical protein
MTKLYHNVLHYRECHIRGTMARLVLGLYNWNEGPVGNRGGDSRDGWALGTLDLC